METIQKIADLSSDEIRRVHQTLVQRHSIGPGQPILMVGFGIAQREGKLDHRRGDTLCFYVPRKREPISPADRLPRHATVRLRRGNRYVAVTLPTDVLTLDVNQLTMTGRTIRHLRDRDVATASAVLAWRIGRDGRWHWGALTVGHLFRHRPQVPESDKLVRIEVRPDGGRNRRWIQGRLLIRSGRRDPVDAALVSVQRRSLQRGGVMPDESSITAQTVRPLDQLPSDPGQMGMTLPGGHRVPFMVLRYLPVFDLIAELGTMKHFLEVHSDQRGAFGRGLSGSLWTIQRQPSCHQCIGWQSSVPAENYVRGGGQSLQFVLQWLQFQLARKADVPQHQVELRLLHRL